MDEVQYVERLRRVADTSGDPEMHDVFWRYREGALTRREVAVHPAFTRAVQAEFARGIAAFEASGHSMAELRDRVRQQVADIEAAEAAEAAGRRPPPPPGHLR